MKIPLPFPECKKCGNDSKNSFHKNCGGSLSIETTSDEVYCSKCKKSWNIWKSTYYCSCGNVFESNDVRDTLIEVLAFCRVCAEEIILQKEAEKQRIITSEKSLRVFLGSFLEKLGYSFGVAVGTIIDIISNLFFKK